MMEEEKMSSFFTLDELIEQHLTYRDSFVKELGFEATEEGRNQLELNKTEEDEIINKLRNRKERLLMSPIFLLLIADESDKKVFKTINTYIETQSEARFFADKAIDKLLKDNHIELKIGSYIGIIVRKALYDSAEDKDYVPNIFNNANIYITSKQIVSSNDGIAVF